jgi:hypothetical protein
MTDNAQYRSHYQSLNRVSRDAGAIRRRSAYNAPEGLLMLRVQLPSVFKFREFWDALLEYWDALYPQAAHEILMEPAAHQ